MAERIQRKRTKGWQMPPNTVSVTRPGKWGNPFPVGGYVRLEYHVLPMKIQTPAQAVALYEMHAKDDQVGKILRATAIKELRGKNLACFCPLDQPCHADVLLEIANHPLPPAGEGWRWRTEER